MTHLLSIEELQKKVEEAQRTYEQLTMENETLADFLIRNQAADTLGGGVGDAGGPSELADDSLGKKGAKKGAKGQAAGLLLLLLSIIIIIIIIII